MLLDASGWISGENSDLVDSNTKDSGQRAYGEFALFQSVLELISGSGSDLGGLRAEDRFTRFDSIEFSGFKCNDSTWREAELRFDLSKGATASDQFDGLGAARFLNAVTVGHACWHERRVATDLQACQRICQRKVCVLNLQASI
jgi:hypothetical protein